MRTFDTVSAMQAATDLEDGMTCHTNGFHSAGDGGAAYYTVSASGTANSCTVLACANDLFAIRVFTEAYVTLESLNYENVPYSLINSVISSAGIKDVRCGEIEITSSLGIGDYDFSFESITYTGVGSALVIDGIQHRTVTGDTIIADSGTCITITCTDRNCLDNTIAVQYMQAGINGVDILPVNSHGITYNKYDFGRIIASGTGINSFIPSNTNNYSWEGEELFSVQNVEANVGVSFVIEPVDNVSVDGTISGITFLNLAVEGSVTGVYINAGINANASVATAGIKGIIINSMRCREYENTTKFLQLNGYIKNVYIKPTSEIRLSQWELSTRVEKTQEAIVDAPIFNYGMNHIIGKVLACHNNVTYIKQRCNSVMYVDGNIDFADMASDNSTLYMPRLFRIRNSSVGDVTIKLDYFYEESAQDVLFSILEGHKVTVTFPNGSAKTINNTGSARSTFSVSCMRTDNAELTNYYVIRELGIYSS